MFNRILRISLFSLLFSVFFILYAEAKIDERLVVEYDSSGIPISIHIPEKLYDPDLDSFLNIKTISEITVDADNPNFTSEDGVLYSKNMKTLISYPSGKDDKKFSVPDGVEEISDYAFSETNLVEVILPDSVKRIGTYSFFWCYFLEEMLLSKNLEEIGHSPFMSCHNLRKLIIPERVNKIKYLSGEKLVNIIILGNELPAGTYCIPEVIFQPGANDRSGTHDSCYFAHYGINEDFCDQWANSELEAAEEIGLITERTSYGYKSIITRSEFAELVVNMVEKVLGRELTQQKNAFEDTYNIAAEKAYASGIVDGVGNNCFSPGQLVTREQIAAMLCRAITYIETKTGKDIIQLAESIPAAYADKADVSNWAVSSVATLNAAEIMKGTSDTILSPKNNTTVQEAILLVYRIYTLCV